MIPAQFDYVRPSTCEEAVAALAPAAEEHLQWAAGMQQKMVLTQVQSKAAQTIGAVVEGVTAKVKDALGR